MEGSGRTVSVHRYAKLIFLGILAVIIVPNYAWSSTAIGKPRMLEQLSASADLQLEERAKALATSSPKEASQLALDLIFYRKVANSLNLPISIHNADIVTEALSYALDDSTVDWATDYFSPNQAQGAITLPPRDDSRVESLSNLSMHFNDAIAARGSSPVNSVKLLQKAIKLCQDLYLDLSEAALLKELGDQYLYNMSRYSDARFCYDRASWTFAAYGCTGASAIVYDDLGTLYTEIGHYSAAAHNYIEAARQWDSLSQSSSNAAKHLELAGRAYMRAGWALQASHDHSRALDMMINNGLNRLRKAAIASGSYDTLIRSQIEVAVFQRDVGQADMSLDTLEAAEKTSKAKNDHLLIAKVFDEKAKTYAALGSRFVEAAKDKRDLALATAASQGETALKKLDTSASLTAKEARDLRIAADRGARAYMDLKEYAKASEMWQQLADICEKLKLNEERISILRSLASALDMQEKHQESLVVRFTAIAAALSDDRKVLAAQIGKDMIQALIAANDLDNALEAFRELAPIVGESGDIRGVAVMLAGRGTLLANNDFHKDAVRDFRQALDLYTNTVGDPWSAGQVALQLADSERVLGQYNEAIATLEAALDAVERVYSSENASPAIGPERTELIKKLYHQLCSLYVSKDHADKAEALVRKARRYLWQPDLIKEMQLDENAALAQFAASVDLLNGVQDNSVPQPVGIDRLLADDWASYATTCWILEKQYPSVYNELPIDPLDFYKNRAYLPKDSVVISYMQTNSSLLTFVTSSTTAPHCIETVAGKSAIEDAASKLRNALRRAEESLRAGIPVPPVKDWNESTFLEIKEPLSELYDLLVRPVADTVGDNKRVIFVLPDSLAGLPMHALISSRDERVPRFLIQDYEVSYLGRGMLYDLLNRDSREINPHLDRLAIFADPDENLPGAQEEAKVIRNIYLINRSYLGSRATATAFLRECGQAHILHIAAHHKIDPSTGGFQLLLAPDENEKSDGSISIRDMADIVNPNLGLVVLSACESLSSTDPISSGPVRTAEVFSAAGAKSVLGGLWKVSDTVASTIMGDFYRNISKAKSRTDALRRAQLAVIESKEYAHPFYWACFALFGNPR